MARLWLGVLVVVALGAFGVAWMIARPPAPKGYSGLEFAQMTGAAAARAPLLATHGALVLAVADNSPASRAGIPAGAVVAPIARKTITSARHASAHVRPHKSRHRILLPLLDQAPGPLPPQQ